MSYTHEPAEDARRVEQLAGQLRARGFEVAWDRDVTAAPGPPEGWPRWMSAQIEAADWVLIVCSATYYDHFRGRPSGDAGLGSTFEGMIIGHTLYGDATLNRKFVPVLLEGGSPSHIPMELRGATFYRLPAQLDDLTAALAAAPNTGVMPSRRMRRTLSRTTLESLALVLLVVILASGWWLSRQSNFSVTVYVTGAGPVEGAVLLDVGGDRRRAPIRENADAYFPEIPASFRGKVVNVTLDAAGYETADSPAQARLDSTSVYLPVRRKEGLVRGSVRDESGSPVAGASVRVASLSATTDSAGRFDLTIPRDQVRAELPLQVVARDHTPWHGRAIPYGGEITVLLTPTHKELP